ncbi:MAG: hypothetical protein OEY81_03010 [Candidatus Bathyarchaeota archaeon]|nr:hypothetical protein [Candidatus Bathyarchaeota archaeon]
MSPSKTIQIAKEAKRYRGLGIGRSIHPGIRGNEKEGIVTP